MYSLLVFVIFSLLWPSLLIAQTVPEPCSFGSVSRIPKDLAEVQMSEIQEQNGRSVMKNSGELTNGWVVNQYPSGKLERRVAFVNGLAEGLWQEWYPTGIPRYLATWRDGKGEGVWIYFHPNGVIRERSCLVSNVSNGPVETWYPSGVKQSEGSYTNNRRDGRWRFWDEDGKFDREELYPSPFYSLDDKGRQPQLLFGEEWQLTDLHRWEFAFTQNGRTILFATGPVESATGGPIVERQIMMQTWNGESWSAPMPAPFTVAKTDGGASLSPDGKWFYFSRSAAAPKSRRDLYRIPIGKLNNSPQQLLQTPEFGEVNVSLDRQGKGFMWSDRALDGRNRPEIRAVQLINNRLIPGAPVAALRAHGGGGANSPWVDPWGRFLIFANYGIGPNSQEDLFVSRIIKGVVQKPESLGALINTPANESNAVISPDGRFLLFTSDRPVEGRNAGLSRIWAVPISQVPALASFR
jgi:hypothetical protein